ncbi:MAG: hypothetical protein WCO94_07380 [Verrucomicrobiota bacterium]
MRILLTSIFLLAGAWTLHLIIWRIHLPKRHIKALLIGFGIVLAGWLGLAVARSIPVLELFQVAMLYGSLALTYIITYTAIESDSPTLRLVRDLQKAGRAGLSVEDLERFVAARPFVKARLEALIYSGLVSEKGNRYRVCGRPSLFFRVILGFRKLYGPISTGG